MAAQRSTRLNGYREEVHFALDMGEGPLLRHGRERLSQATLTPAEQAELVELDADVIDTVLVLDEVASYLLDDDPAQPLAHWWWHLGKLRTGTYPADLLPPPLRLIYQQRRHAA